MSRRTRSFPGFSKQNNPDIPVERNQSSNNKRFKVTTLNRNEKPDKYDEEDSSLYWRIDPEKSLADWTIEIEHNYEKDKRGEGGFCNIDIYHVHKAVLSTGHNQSHVLSSYFKNAQDAFSKEGEKWKEEAEEDNDITRDIKNSITRYKASSEIEVNIFPTFLDYLYESKPTATYENKIRDEFQTIEGIKALLALGNSFGAYSWKDLIYRNISSKNPRSVLTLFENCKDWENDDFVDQIARNCYNYCFFRVYDQNDSSSSASFSTIKQSLLCKHANKYSFDEWTRSYGTYFMDKWISWIAGGILKHMTNDDPPSSFSSGKNKNKEYNTRISKTLGTSLLAKMLKFKKNPDLGDFEFCYFSRTDIGKVALIYLKHKFGNRPNDENWLFLEWMAAIMGNEKLLTHFGGEEKNAKKLLELFPKDLLIDILIMC